MIADEKLIVGRDRGTGMSRSATRNSAAGRPGRSASACQEAPRAWLPRACRPAIAGSSREASRQRAPLPAASAAPPSPVRTSRRFIGSLPDGIPLPADAGEVPYLRLDRSASACSANAVSTQRLERNGAIERAAGPHGRLQSVETLTPQHRIRREQLQRAIAVDRAGENVGRNRGEVIGQRTGDVRARRRGDPAQRASPSRGSCAAIRRGATASSERRVTSVV